MIDSVNTLRLLTATMISTSPLIPTAPDGTNISIKTSSVKQMINLLKNPPLCSPMGKYVGELQEKWVYPSDHLPIGMSWDGLHFASWNVLNNAYMSYVENNTQGLARSLIIEENEPIDSSGLTKRDLHVAQMVNEMLSHPTHPKSLISLQECSPYFLDKLEESLPEHYKLIRDSKTSLKDHNAIVYDTRTLRYIEEVSCIAKGVFSIDKRTFMDIVFERLDTNEKFNVLNAHLPGEPGNPAPLEFANYAANKKSGVIAMGDMNFNELEMNVAFKKTGKDFTTLTPYCTNINVFDYVSKAIDHFFVSIPNSKGVTCNQAEEVQIDLQSMIDLIQ